MVTDMKITGSKKLQTTDMQKWRNKYVNVEKQMMMK